MGCAQETFIGILNYLHREFINPQYFEEYKRANKDQKFKMDNQLDDTGCAPKCASHLTFGMELCDIVQCVNCDIVGKVKEKAPEFIH